MKQDGAEDSRGTPPEPGDGPLTECQRIAAKLLNEWQQGADADVAAAIARNPELGHHKSIVRDLAYEEFCQRTDRGESVDIEQFADRFVDCRMSLLRQLELHRLLDDCPELPDKWLETAWPKLGEEFLGFRIRECLGRGAFARVYLATEPALGNRLVAVKVSASGLEEADILGKLDHNHIVPIHSVQFDPRTALSAICMPYLGRATLVDVLDRIAADKRVPESAQIFRVAIAGVAVDGHTPSRPSVGRRGAGDYVDAVMTIGWQLADALAEAHRHGVFHLDLKPSNVLLTDAGRPMLLDFNLAHDQQQFSVRQGGTLPYMAPEQLAMFCSPAADSPQSDLARADIYSLGVVLYELLTGRLPFPVPATATTNERRVAALVEAQRTGAAPIRSLNPRVPESLAALVEKCLACNPPARFASANELVAAIRAEYGVVRRTIRWTGRHKRFVAGMLALLVVASIVGVTYARYRQATYYLRQIALGDDLQRQGNYGEAIKAFDRAYEDHPAALETLVRRAEVRMAQGDFARANLDLQEYLDHRDDPRAMVLAAYCFQMDGSDVQAAKSYRRAIERGLDTALVRNNLGHACDHCRAFDEAKTHLERAVALDPALQAAQHNLAMIEAHLAELRGQKPISAIAAIERAVELGEPSAELFLNAAVIHAQALRYDASSRDDAIKSIRRAIEAGTPIETLSNYPTIKSLLESIPTTAANAPAASSSAQTHVRLVNPLGVAENPLGATATILARQTP